MFRAVSRASARTTFSASPRMVRNVQHPTRSAHDSASAPSTTGSRNTVGPMLEFETSLPGLPVPTLNSTAAKYLETVKPHLTAEEYRNTRAAVEKFVASPFVHELQDRLTERAANADSWLSEWWNDVAYMGYRDPVVVFVSYFYVYLDDPQRKTPAKRAAGLLKAILAFRELVESQKLAPETVRKQPLAMSSYKWLFNSSRYPAIPADTAEKFDPASNNHVIFIRKNKFYEVSTVHNGVPLSAAELEEQVTKVIDAAGSDYGVPVGALTSDNRDNWTKARETLVSNPINAETLKRIESAIIVFALDDTSPTTRKETSWNCWVGDGKNRFYDKHQVIIFENGRAGFLGEHSCMYDGTPTLRMSDFIMGGLHHNKIDVGSAETRSLPAPVELTFQLNDAMKKDIATAEKNFDALVGSHDMEVLHFDKYGKEQIKTYKVSPDAWAQLVKQLAFHKMFGRPGVCYESAQTRKFKLGRTEVIRAASNESKEWAEAMLNPKETDAQREILFKRAVNRHLQYAAWAADGQGVDRHLFGLKKIMKEGETLPEIYTDPAFSRTNHWELSTSNLSSPWLDGWGYGEVVPDGYGLSYSIGDDYIRWTITSLKRDTAKLKAHLEEAAIEVKAMLDRAAATAKPKL